jgi:antitoxin HicB
MDRAFRYSVIFEPAAEGGYVVTCPALPGLVTEGDTLDEAREMVRDAIQLYLESLLADGLKPPVERTELGEPIKEVVEIHVDAA